MTFASVRSAVDGEQSSHGTTIASGFGVSRSEDSDRHVSLALGGAVAVMDGPMPEFDSVGAAIAERVARVERFRQVLQVHRLDLGAPHWAEDPTFDPHRHIHRAALPHGGDDQALFRFVADVMERRLDRDRPLWECWIIEGVAGGRWGSADEDAPLHRRRYRDHADVRRLSDSGSPDTFATDIRASRVTASAPRRAWSGAESAGMAGGALWHVATTLTDTASRSVAGALQIAGGTAEPGSRIVADGTGDDDEAVQRRTCSTSRRGANSEQVRCHAQRRRPGRHHLQLPGCLIRRGEEPQKTSLRTLVPVSVRATDAMNLTDNRVSLMLPLLPPVDKDDPLEQLQSVRHRLTRSKKAGQREAVSIFVTAVGALPFALTAWAARALMRSRNEVS